MSTVVLQHFDPVQIGLIGVGTHWHDEKTRWPIWAVDKELARIVT